MTIQERMRLSMLVKEVNSNKDVAKKYGVEDTSYIKKSVNGPGDK